jgi:hypothetical protein
VLDLLGFVYCDEIRDRVGGGEGGEDGEVGEEVGAEERGGDNDKR